MKWVWRALGVLAVLLLLAGGGLWWLIGSESGLRWTTGLASSLTDGKLRIDAARGALGSTMSFERIVYTLDATTVEAVNVKVRTALGAALNRTLAIDDLSIERLTVHLAPAPEAAPAPVQPTLPASLALPLEVRLTSASIGTLEVVRPAATTQVRDVYVSYEGGKRRHRLRSLRVDTGFGYLGAAGSIEATRPFALDVAAVLERPGTRVEPPTPLDLPAHVHVHLGGTLRELAANADAALATARATLSAQLVPFERPWPDSLRSLQVRAQALDLAVLAPTLPRTAISVRANASGATGSIKGEVEVDNAQAGSLDQQRLPVKSVRARFVTDLASGRLDRLAIDLAPGGSLTGSGELQREPLTARLEIDARELDLRALGSTLRATALSGPLQIVARSPQEQTLSGTLAQDDLRIAAHAQRSGDQVDITDLSLAARGSALTGKGQVRLGEPTRFDAALRFKHFDPARFGAFPTGDINGSADVEGQLGEARRIEARWEIAHSTLRQRPLASRGQVRLAGEHLDRIDASARLGTNELFARGAFGAANDRLQWRVAAPALGELADGVGGALQASGTLTGPRARMRVEVTASARQLRLPGAISVQSLRLEGRAGLQPEAPLDLDLVAQAVATPQARLDRITLATKGRRGEHEANLQVTAGARSFAMRAHGGWSGELPGKWAGEITTATLHGDDTDALDAHLGAPVPLTVAPGAASLRDLQLVLSGAGAPSAQFKVDEFSWQDGRLVTRGAFERLATQWLAAFVTLPAGMETTVSLGGDWSLRADPRVNGALSIHRESGDVRLAGPPAIDSGLSQATLDARFDDSRITADLAVAGKFARMQAHATVAPAPGVDGIAITPESPVTFDAKLDVAEVRLITEPLLTAARVAGRVAANLNGSGTLGAPRIEGTLTADALAVDVPPYGVELKEGRLRAQLHGDTVQVTEFAIRGGDGRFTAAGEIPLRPAEGKASLRWHAESFRVLNRPDMRLVVSGDGSAGFAQKKFALRGELRAESGHFELARRGVPELGDDVVVLGEEPEQPSGTGHAPLDLDLQVDLGKALSVRGFGLDGKATGRLHLTTSSDGELRATGRVQAVDATFRAYGQQLVVQPGVLVFDGPLDNPTLQITAWRRNQQVEAGVQLSGSAKAPRVTLVSEPQVPEGERLSWLVLGRAPGDATGGDIALLQGAAGALLGGGDSVPLTQKVAGSLGLDELAVRSSSEIASSVVAVGKRLSDRLFVTYEHGLGAAAENLVKLDYSLTRRISLRAETGSTTGVGIFYRFSWD